MTAIDEPRLVRGSFAKAPSVNRQRPFDLDRGNWRSCPTADLPWRSRRVPWGVPKHLIRRSGKLAQLGLECVEVDRLGEELGGAESTGALPAFIIAISGYHHHRDRGE